MTCPRWVRAGWRGCSGRGASCSRRSAAFAAPAGIRCAAGERPFTRLVHYPAGNLDDPGSGYLWYYHAHEPGTGRPDDEHGHFHLFAYPGRFAGRPAPLLPPREGTPGHTGGFPHLFGLSVGPAGKPFRLFTLNRWAPNEPLHPARDVLAVADRFAITPGLPLAPVSRWLEALTRLLHPQLAWLIAERDRVLATHRARDPEGYGEDRALEVISTLGFDLEAIYAALDRAGAAEGALACRSFANPLAWQTLAPAGRVCRARRGRVGHRLGGMASANCVRHHRLGRLCRAAVLCKQSHCIAQLSRSIR